MSDPEQNETANEVERLRAALETETRLRLEVQRQLEAANMEFEEFVSMSAHNLREPLREVSSFSQLMAETCAGRLDSDATDFLGRIQQGAARIQALLTGVVDYWAITTNGHRHGPADMEAALCQALLGSDELIALRGAAVTHDTLPEVRGDFEILTKVLHHLVENAILYGDPVSPRVHVSSKRVDTGWEISVQDNGPGIAPAFQDRVFLPFRRLHGRDYPGIGLGLALCKKAIEGQGGRIRLESIPGSGSTFFFTIANS